MDSSIRPIISGIIGAILAHVLIRWLGRRFPIGPKPHPLTWYAKRYWWIEKACLIVFLTGLGVAFFLYQNILSHNDPRGVAVGLFLGCFLACAVLVGITNISPTHSFREYWDYQELKYGVRNVLALYLVVPFLAVSIYGTIHLLVKGI